MLELLRFLTLIWAAIGTVLSGQRSAADAFNRFYADFTMANIPEDLAYIRSQTDFIASELTAVDTGLAAISGKADSIIALLGGGVQDVLDAIAALPAGSDIVIPTPAENAAGVWTAVTSATPNPGGFTTGAQLAEAWGDAHEFYQWQAARVSGNPLFTVESTGGNIIAVSTSFAPPSPDFSDVLPGESVVDWLNRTDTSGRTWAYDSTSGLAVTFDTLPGENWYAMRCLLRTTSEIDGAGAGPPIWPGVAGVTLGTTVPCAESTVLELPMDGLLILITSYPATRSRWGAPPYLSVYHTGRLAFVTDNGDVEEFQYMGWTNAIYTPRSMKRAAGVVIFLEANVEAAATPWDITT